MIGARALRSLLRAVRHPIETVRTRDRLGLGGRVTLSFGAGALVLCVALSSITYVTARNALINQAETSIEQQASSNAEATEGYLAEGFSPADILNFISGASSGQNAVSFLYQNHSWSSPNSKARYTLLPKELRDKTISGSTAYVQVIDVLGGTRLAVGVPIVSGARAYFGLFSLNQVQRTLLIILASLGFAVVVTTAAGAVLGWWVSRRALRPLRDVSDAALAIANGSLATRVRTGDVRELGILADSFNRMVERLQERIEREARFTSDVSHELRSPLTTLAASLSVIEARRDELPPRSGQALDLLTTEMRRFQQLVGDLLEISRLDAGVADFEPSIVEVGPLVRRAARSWGKATIPVVVRPDVVDRLVAVDKRRFERVVANLLDNARHYAGGATRIVVEQRDSRWMRLLVEDRGPGIAENERERVFERFARGGTTAGQRGATVGTGLGLALVSEHVKLHGGTVSVEARIGGGARFVIELPLADEFVGDDERVVDVDDSDDTSATAAALRMVVLGDDSTSASSTSVVDLGT